MSEIGSTKEVSFRPRARVVNTIGGDLIKDEMAGVIELVKNAYDADATEVSVAFRNLDGGGSGEGGHPGEIEISDDGHGMTLSTLLEDWMSPATGEKGERTKSPGGRAMLGRKGVGRFSAMRLGEKLTLVTRPGRRAPGASEEELASGYRIQVNWADFRDSDAYLDEVLISVESYSGVAEDDHGTELSITSLTEEWDSKRLRRLLRELRLLLSPIPTEEQQHFKITLDLDDSGLDEEVISAVGGTIEPYDLPQVTDYRVEAEIDGRGAYKFTYERDLLADQDRDEVKVEEKGPDIRERYCDWETPEEGEVVNKPLPSGPLSFEIRIWDRDRELLDQKVEALQDEEIMGVRALRRFLDEVSGVAVYRDGFRVRPYGEEEADWLGLGQRRVQNPTLRLGPNQLFGLIEISSVENPNLQDRSSREGLKENEAFEALRQCVLAALGWCEPIRRRFRARRGLGRPDPESTQQLESERERAFEELDRAIDEEVDDEDTADRFRSLISTARDTSEREHERLTQQAQIMHDMHGLGIVARWVLHEGRNLDTSLNSALNNLERVADQCYVEDGDRLEIAGGALAKFRNGMKSSRLAQRRLHDLFKQLDPLSRPRRGRRSKVVVEEIAESVRSLLEPRLDDANVDLSISEEEHTVLAWPADLYHALFNLIENSIYWTQQVSGDRKIEIDVTTSVDTAAPDEEEVEIRVRDSGPGVSLNAADVIFELGYTEKSQGYGAGLFIARESIERSNGKLELLNPGEMGGCFKITMPGA